MQRIILYLGILSLAISACFNSQCDPLEGEQIIYVSGLLGKATISIANDGRSIVDKSPFRVIELDVSSDNEIVYVLEGVGKDDVYFSEIYLTDIHGDNDTLLVHNTGPNRNPQFSPNGTIILFTTSPDYNLEVFSIERGGNNQINLTNNIADDREPAWSPDGNKIAFVSDRDGNNEIYLMNSNGSNVEKITDNPADDREPAWSPDGTKITFVSDREGNNEIYLMNSDGSNVEKITDNPADDREPAWSPDGTKIAFVSDRDGNKRMIYISCIAEKNGISLLRTNGIIEAYSPKWLTNND